MLSFGWALSCLCFVNSQRWGTVRLVGGDEPTHGLLQVFLYNRWGTVCRSSWSTASSEVVCKQMGFTDVAAADFYYMSDNTGTAPIHLNYVSCSGTERNILECPSSESVSYCTHANDIFVQCGCLTTPICPKPATNCPYFRHEIVKVNHSACPICRCASCPEKPNCPTNCKSGKTMYYQGQTCRRCKCRPQELPDFIQEPIEIPLPMMSAVVGVMFVVPVIALVIVLLLKRRQDFAAKAKAAAAKKAAQQQEEQAAEWFSGDVAQC
ncbi:hypothetical protein ACOMHN_022383 [Nucella lapillus]